MKKAGIKTAMAMFLIAMLLLVALAYLPKITQLTGYAAAEQEGKITIQKNKIAEIDLTKYFGEGKTYLATTSKNLTVEIMGNTLMITPDRGFVGERTIKVFVSGAEITEFRLRISVVDTGPSFTEVMQEEMKMWETKKEEPVQNATVTQNITSNRTNETNTTRPQTNTTEPEQNKTQPSITKPQPEENITAEEIKIGNKKIGQKIEDEPLFNVYFTQTEKNNETLTLKFYHDSNKTEKITIKGDTAYTLSKKTAKPFENITLAITLDDGIIPEFELHVGETSETFKFGKKIPQVWLKEKKIKKHKNKGNDTEYYQIIDRDDDLVDVLISKEEASVYIKGANTTSIKALFEWISSSVLTTEVFAAEPIDMEEAIITLPRTDDVTAVVECTDFNFTTKTCSGEWTVTGLPFNKTETNVTFTVYHFSGYGGGNIAVINVQSYPELYGNWTVMFNTTGTANLTITAIDGTTWTDYAESGYDLKFLEIKCGNQSLNYSWINNSVFIPNYHCDELGYETSKVLTTGKHALKFEFGTDSDYAYNNVCIGIKWSVYYEGNPTESDPAYGVTTNSYDDVVVVGSGGGVPDVFKYNKTNGNQIWNATLTGNGAGIGVDTDSLNNYYIAGLFNFNFFMAKYNDSGSLVWNKSIDLGTNDLAWGVAVDKANNITFVGTTGNDMYIMKTDPSGTYLWNKTVNFGGTETAYAVDTDSANNIYVAGGNGDSILIKYNSAGTHQWNKTYTIGNYYYAVTVDSADNVIAVGDVGNDWFIIKYDSSGNNIWNKTLALGTTSRAYGVDTDSDRNVIVTGSISQNDYFTIKYDSNGNHLWNATYNSGYTGDVARSVAADTQSNIIVTGAGNVSGTHPNFYTIKYEFNTPANQSKPILNSTDGTNRTSQNLTVYTNVADTNNNPITNITNWYKNGASYAVLNMPFDTNVSSTAAGAVKDYTSYNNNGRLGNGNSANAPTWVASGKSGGAYRFDGVNDYIVIPYNASLNPSNAITIEAWVNSSSSTIGTQKEVVESSDWTKGYRLYVSENKIRAIIAGTVILANTAMSTNTWYHIAMTWNGTNLSVWLNGQFDGSTTATGTITTTGTTTIGAYTGLNTEFFNGTIDEIRIYDRALTPEQILANYNSGAPKYNKIVSQELSNADTWYVEVTPNDGYEDGNTLISNGVQVGNAPTQDVPLLVQNGNLTVTPQNLSDIDGDAITNITNWYRNGTSITVLNMPFEGLTGRHSVADSSTVLAMYMENNFKDFSGNNNHGNCSGTGCPTYNSSGKVGGAYRFDGVNNYINVPDNSFTDISGPITISLWIYRPTGSSTVWRRIIAKEGWGTSDEGSWAILYDDTNRAFCMMNISGTWYGTPHDTSDSDIPADKWTLVTCTYTGSAIDLYLNGIKKTSVSASGTLALSNFNVTIGAMFYGGSIQSPFDGYIDEVHIFNRSLNASEVRDLYKKGAPPYVVDYSSFGNDGIVKGATWTSGISGGAYYFGTGGGGTCIDVGFSPSLNITKEMSVEAWVNVTSNAQWVQYIVDRWTYSTGNYRAWSLDIQNLSGTDSLLTWRVSVNGTDEGAKSVSYAYNGKENEWHHLVGTYNGSNLTLYVDGNQVAIGAGPANIVATNKNLFIGGGDLGTSYSMAGYIDEVRIYNRSLTAEQVAANYNAGAPKYNIVVPQEYSNTGVWSASVTPNDGFMDGTTMNSDNITIANVLTGCAQLNASTSYILGNEANISTSGGTCFNIAGDNITLDCKGNKVRAYGAGISNAYAFNSVASATRNNFTLKNCFVQDFGYGVYGLGSTWFFNRSTFYNNTFNSTTYYAIRLGYTSMYNNISYNTFTNQESSGYATLFMEGADFSYIHGNNFTNNTGYDIGFTTNAATGNDIRNNFIDKSNRTGYAAYAVYFDATAQHAATFENNTIINMGTYTGSYAYYIGTGISPPHRITFIGQNLANGENVTDYFLYRRENATLENIIRGKTNILNLGQLILFETKNVTIKNSVFVNHSTRQIGTYNITNVNISNNKIENGTYAVEIANAPNITSIENNNITTSGYGMYISGTAADYGNITIRNNKINHTLSAPAIQSGISYFQAQAIIEGNNITGIGSANGIVLSSNGGSQAGHPPLLIKNNYISKESFGIYEYNPSSTSAYFKVLITNNTINSTTSGIVVDNQGITISDNKISNCPGATYAGIHGRTDSRDNIIANNTVTNCSYGIELQSQFGGYNVTNNTLNNNRVWGIKVTDNYMDNNISHDNRINSIEPYYYYKEPGLTINNFNLSIAKGVSSGVITLVNCPGSTITNSNFSSNGTGSSDGLAPGIGLYNVSNSIISNNTINKTYYGIYLYVYSPKYLANNVTIQNNIIENSARHMIYHTGSGTTDISDLVINNNTLNNMTENYAGIYLTGKNRNNITNNKLSNLYNGINTGGQITNTTISYNNISNIKNYAIYLQGASSNSNTISYNNITNANLTTSGRGIVLATTAYNNTIHHNIINSTYYGIYYDTVYANNSAYSNEIYGARTSAFYFNPTYKDYPRAWQNIHDNKVCFNAKAITNSTGFSLTNISWHNNSFCIINMYPTDGQTIYNRTPKINFNATNIVNTSCTANIDNIASGTNASLGPDNSNQSIQVNRTLSSGNHTLNITCSDSYDDRAEPNLITFNLPTICGDTLTSNTTLNQNHTCNGTAFTIGADNITLDCAGYTLTGNGSGGFGILIPSNSAGITIKNCILRDFNQGVGSNSPVSSCVLFNNTAINCSIGLSLQGGTGNNIEQNNITANSTIGIQVSSQNSTLKNNTVSGADVAGIQISGTNVTISGGQVHSNPAANGGIQISGSRNTVTGVTIYNNSANGIYIYGNEHNITGNTLLGGQQRQIMGDTGLYNTTITNNVINNQTGAFDTGIDLWENNNITIFNNTIQNAQTQAISTINTNNTVIQNCTLSGNNKDIIVQQNSNNIQIIDTRIANYMFSAYTGKYFSLENTTTGKVNFLSNVSGSGSDLFGSTASDVRITNNLVFVNSSAKPGLNVSANITLYGVTLASPRIYADRNDDGIYEERCMPPTCYNLSYIAGTFIFNSTHFTFYNLNSTMPPTHDTPILNSTYGTNQTTENLTVYPQNVTDIDNDTVVNITNWYVNNNSITVLNLPFDLNNNTFAKDYSPYGNNGTVINANWTNVSISGGAYEFDGTSSYINVTDANSLDLPDNITLEAWVKLNSVPTTNVYIFTKGIFTNSNYILYIRGTDGKFEYRAGPPTGQKNVVSTTVVTNGTWYHVVATRNGNTTNMSIYVNGVKENETVGATVPVTTTNLFIGSNTGAGGFFNGTMDEMRIYNRTLTAQQILSQYNAGVPNYRRIVSSELRLNDTWMACVTPTDGMADGITKCSNNLTLTDTTPPYIVWDSQIPPDVSSTNLFDNILNITYNITDTVSGVDNSTVKLYYKTNSSVSDCMDYINGTEAHCGYRSINYSSAANETYLFHLFDNLIYPARYNLEERMMDLTLHNVTTLTNNNQLIKIRLFNVSNSSEYGMFEVMANTTGTGVLRLYYCNSSYTTGNVMTSPHCTDFYNIPASATYNHTHSNYSSHQVAPFAINTTSGTIGGIKVTPTSYFILRGITGTTWNIYYLQNISRPDTIQTSNNNGVAWTNFSGTIDAHLHQYMGNDTLWYYACANDTLGNANCSAPRYDLLNLSGIPPTAPYVYSPTNDTYYIGTNISINYTAAQSPNGYAISHYNISLLNSTYGFNKTIITNNSLNLSYLWDTTGMSEGIWIIRVEACDVLNQCSFGYSEEFNLSNITGAVSILTTYPDINVLNYRLDDQMFIGMFETLNGTGTNSSFDQENTCQLEQEYITGTGTYNMTLFLNGTAVNMQSLQLICSMYAYANASAQNCTGSNDTDHTCANWVGGGNTFVIDLTNSSNFNTSILLGNITPQANCSTPVCWLNGTWAPGDDSSFNITKQFTVADATSNATNPNGTLLFTTDKYVGIHTLLSDINVLNFQLRWQNFTGTFDTSAGTCIGCRFDLDNGTCQAEVEKIYGMFQSYNMTINMTPDRNLNFTSLNMICRLANDTVSAHSNCSGLFTQYGVGTSGCANWANSSIGTTIPGGVSLDIHNLTTAGIAVSIGTITPNDNCKQVACELNGSWQAGNTESFTINKTITVTAIS